MKEEMAKPGKDGLEKTQKECEEAFSKVLKDEGFKKSTFLRNAGLWQSKSKSKSMSLEDQEKLAAVVEGETNAGLLESKSESMYLEDKEKLAAVIAERETSAQLREDIDKMTGRLSSQIMEVKYLKKILKKVIRSKTNKVKKVREIS